MTQINPDEISSIQTILNAEVLGYEYREEKKFLGIVTRKAGFYYWVTLNDYLVTQKELQSKGYIVFYNGVYHKPSLKITMKNGNVFSKSFDTEQKLTDFKEIYFGKHWITL